MFPKITYLFFGLIRQGVPKNCAPFHTVLEYFFQQTMGTTHLEHIVLQSKELYKQWILIQILSKSVEN